MHYLFARIVLRETPEPVICSTDRGPTVFCSRHDVDVLETRFTDDPLVGDTVQCHTPGVTEILAARQLTHMLSEVDHGVFECRLDRTRERCVLALPIRPPLGMSKAKWN